MYGFESSFLDEDCINHNGKIACFFPAPGWAIFVSFYCSVCFSRSRFATAGHSSSEESKHSEMNSLRVDMRREDYFFRKKLTSLEEDLCKLMMESRISRNTNRG